MVGRNANGPPVREKSLTIGRDKMRQSPALPDVTMQPETSVHRVDHPFSTRMELPEGQCGLLFLVIIGTLWIAHA